MGSTFLYITVVVLISLGSYSVLFKRNLIKITIAINLLDSGINLFFIGLGYRQDATAPIFTLAPQLDTLRMVLPTPHALILTNIVIGFATTALMLTLAIITFRNNNTLDTAKLRGIETDD